MTIVPFFDWPGLYHERALEFSKIIQETLSSGHFILQKDVEIFEKNLAKFVGADFAVGVSDGTNAILLGLRASNIKPGDEIIIPSHSFIAAAQSIHFAGGIPVPVELDEDDWLISPEAIESAITPKTRAIMPVHVNGRMCKMEQILSIAKKYSLDIYEDSAQAMGASFKGRGAGTIGSWGTYSFYPSKTLGSFGDAGALVTNDPNIYEAVRAMRNHGANMKKQISTDISIWGTNARLDNIQAAILNYKLSYYSEAIARRRYIAQCYHSTLQGIEGIRLPPPPNEDSPYFDVFQNYEFCCSKRDQLKNFLSENNIGSIIQWGGFGVHQLTNLINYCSLPKTDRFFKESILLPMNHLITDEQLDHVIKILKNFIKDFYE